MLVPSNRIALSGVLIHAPSEELFLNSALVNELASLTCHASLTTAPNQLLRLKGMVIHINQGDFAPLVSDYKA